MCQSGRGARGVLTGSPAAPDNAGERGERGKDGGASGSSNEDAGLRVPGRGATPLGAPLTQPGTQPANALEVSPGDVLAGKYRVERILGIGGMGVVVSAHHVQLDEKVALKFLLPEARANEAAVARFLQEARAAVKVKSEHVARVIDVGQLENGSPYMVMEFLDGRDLSALLAERGPLPVDVAVDFLLQTCEALADAHTLGIVHRDLKPANLFCIHRSDGQPSIKVLDFGISKVTKPGTAGHDMTRTSALMGSPLYMSPEQMKQSKSVDSRTDIWALGVILFELITANRPFHAEGVTELAIKIATEPALSVRELRPDLPPGIDVVIARCLEKDRAQRFQTVGDLAIALRDFASPHGRTSVDRVLGTLRKAGTTFALAPPSAPVGPTTGSRTPNGVISQPGVEAKPQPQTGSSWGQTGAKPSSGGKAAVWIGVALVLGAMAIAGGTFVYKHNAASVAPMTAVTPPTALPAPSATQVVVPAAVAKEVPPSPLPTPAAAPVPSVAATSVATTPTASPAAPAAPSKPGHGHAAHAPAEAPRPSTTATPAPASPAAPAPAPAKANCNPPYVIDAAGDRQYKPECL